jgi:superfamily II DNA or RNA helicase
MSKYPNLLQDGKLFPSWIIYNFKEYKIPIQEISNDDGCKKLADEFKLELRSYQKFLSKYLDYNSPYTSILLYHGLGSGKTASVINVYNNLYNYTDQWNVFILLKAALKESTWIGRDGKSGELGKWLSENDKENRLKNIKFLSYDSPIADQQFNELIKLSDSSKKNLYIIDEAHNFIRNVYSNTITQKGKKAQTIYDYIVQEKMENSSTRVILISATPMINEVYELGLLFNLLRPNIFPRNETKFNELFIDNIQHNKISTENINMFQRRIIGLVSYYESIDPTTYAKKIIEYVDVKMSKYQKDIYRYYDEIEKKSNALNYSKSNVQNKTYKTFTRQSCNFVFPTIDGIDGERRPRPSQFKIDEKDAEDIMKAKISKTDKISASLESKFMNKEGYLKALKNYIETFKNYINNLIIDDKKNEHTAKDDIKNILEIYNKDPNIKINNIIFDYIKDKKSSTTLNALYNCSAKYICMIFNIINSKGPVIMYSNYVLMEGIEIFKIYLNIFNYSLYDKNKINESHDYLRYCEYHGNVSLELREIYKKTYNLEENKYGKLIKIICISPAGTEGISLSHVRQIHITEPHWNEVRISQMIGRGIRFCSHKYLPLNERVVNIYRYKSITDEFTTTDQYVETIAKNKETIINSFLNAMKEVAVDCELNIEINKLTNPIKCFKFEESALLTKQIAPAYKQDIIDDIQINSGSNSTNSVLKKIKVIKIDAVQQIDKEETKFTDTDSYWLNSETGGVYEYKYKYLIGQLKHNEFGDFVRKDKNIFIIDKLVPYPNIKAV